MRFLENWIFICLLLANFDIALSERRRCWDEWDNMEFLGSFKEVEGAGGDLEKCKQTCLETNRCHVVKLYQNPNLCFINDDYVVYRSITQKVGYIAYFLVSCDDYERRKGTTTTTTTTAQPASSESEQTHSDESLETHDDGLEDLSKDSPSEDSEASATVSMPGSNGSELENVGMRNELNAKDGSVSSLDSRTSDGNPSASLESNKKSAEEGNPIVIDVNSKKTFGDLNFEDKMSSPELQDDQESIRVGRRLPPSADLPWLSVKLEINMEKPGSKEPGKYLSGSSEDEIESGTNTEQSLVPYGKEDTLAAGTDDDVQSTQSSDTLEKSLHTKNDQGEEMGGSPAEKTHEISEESSKSNQDNVTEEESNGSSATENSDVLEGCSEVSNDE